MNGDDFYVGYVPKAPPSLSRILRRVVLGLAASAAVIAAVLVLGQAPFAESAFEYQQFRGYEGEVVEWPYPMLLTRDERFLLVAEGKHGAAAAVRGLDGMRVNLQGTLIRRGKDTMLELRSGSLRAIDSGAPAAKQSEVDLGVVTLAGEIVDSKCFLGVMNPGNGKVHRDCAVRCISGGIPPAFLARDSGGAFRVLLLTGGDSRPLGSEVLDYVAEPIVISGRLVRSGSAMTLKAEPRDFRRE